MSELKTHIPRADRLMGSMRYMGYSFEAAVADILDNSISANCKNIYIKLPLTANDNIAMGILDDGDGMSNKELLEAMRYGSSSSEAVREENDLGRFGLGMKSASLSQCRILTVVSLKNNKLSAYKWDYNIILKKKDWFVEELFTNEMKQLPYFDDLIALKRGTLVIWEDFDTLDKSSGGMVFDALDTLRSTLDAFLSLTFHRYLSSSRGKVNIFIDKAKLSALDPFLENHPKTTSAKEKTIALPDSTGKEQLITVKPFVLPFLSDLSKEDRKLMGGLEDLRHRQGFYVYRNKRLIIYGTWFNMKPKGELTKNARIRVDIPNSLDDIWSIDVKKQRAQIPKTIQTQLKKIVSDTLEMSVRQQTHRGRANKVDDNVDYIWSRMQGRNNCYYYEINRESALYRYVKENMTDADFQLLEMFLREVEQNFPTQQLYIDRSNNAVEEKVEDNREENVFQLAITLIESAKKFIPVTQAIENIMNAEPMNGCPGLKEKLIEYYEQQ